MPDQARSPSAGPPGAPDQAGARSGVRTGATPQVAACLKLAHLRVDVDPLTGEAELDGSSVGLSGADEAALEWALVIAERHGGEVVAVTAGPGASQVVLRAAIAAGAARAVRVDASGDLASAQVAEVLAPVVASCMGIVCGDASLDRGSGSVPGFLAAELGFAQALGLVGIEIASAGTGAGAAALPLLVERRLDRGRRELLALGGRWVVSVEAATAKLRRARFDRVLAAAEADIEVLAPVLRVGGPESSALEIAGPYRPRARVVAAPSSSLAPRERVLALAGATDTHARTGARHLDPAAAAEAVLEALEGWGELA